MCYTRYIQYIQLSLSYLHVQKKKLKCQSNNFFFVKSRHIQRIICPCPKFFLKSPQNNKRKQVQTFFKGQRINTTHMTLFIVVFTMSTRIDLYIRRSKITKASMCCRPKPNQHLEYQQQKQQQQAVTQSAVQQHRALLEAADTAMCDNNS